MKSESEKDPLTKEELEFEWIQLRKEVGSSELFKNEETTKNKFIRKFKETPLVPIGCLATVLCLGYGLWAMRLGRSRTSQLMMRARIVAQGFTIAAVVAALGFSTVQK